MIKKFFICGFIFSFLVNCSDNNALSEDADQDNFINIAGARIALNSQTPRDWNGQIIDPYINPDPKQSSQRVALFGDLHVHTRYSFDAYIFGTIATPDDAYEFAKGKVIEHPAGFKVGLKKPLDFYSVTDHGTFIGQVAEAATPGTEYYLSQASRAVRDINADGNRNASTFEQRRDAFGAFLLNAVTSLVSGDLDIDYVNEVSRNAWLDTIEAAERHNDPGKFTTFLGYEYTASTNNMGNLHRNVIFRGNGNKVPALPFSRANNNNPEALWEWMDLIREDGIDSIAIPHNSNGSDGAMFALEKTEGGRFNNAYASQRMRNEPIVEITQVKGTSDTHPAFSKNDEWADFEIMPFKVATTEPSKIKGSYVREALLNGIKIEEANGYNPYKFGFIGSSDTHTAASSQEEYNFFSKIGLLDSSSELRGSVPISSPELLEHRDEHLNTDGDDGLIINVGGEDYFNSSSIYWGAAGLAGVWAEENTRDSIFSAFRRKETFATSGPRMKVRFFAGYDLDNTKAESKDLIEYLYSNGVPMGSDLRHSETTDPTFFVWAIRDLDSAALQRIQIVKGWIENNQLKEKVYDVVCSDGLKVDPVTNRCPDNGAKVDIETCSFSDNGANELSSFWSDPDFDKDMRAFYYVRVLENPTCRWSTWDAIREGVSPRPDMQKTIQERAWSSPIHLLNG
tara:strand:+ start:2231 stop:4273 length:2043 start_codon:yes stop_codon:yes gene_type:complete